MINLPRLPILDIQEPSYQDVIMRDFFRKAYREFEDKVKEYLLKNLNVLGYTFDSDEDFIQFVKKRIHRLSFEDRPHYYELYLDFINWENKGTLIGTYSDNVSFTMPQGDNGASGYNMTVTFG